MTDVPPESMQPLVFAQALTNQLHLDVRIFHIFWRVMSNLGNSKNFICIINCWSFTIFFQSVIFSLKPDQVPIQTLDSFGLCFQLFRLLNDDLKEPFLVENFSLINGSELFHSHFEGLALGFVHRCVQVFFLGMLFGRGIRPLSFQVHKSSLRIHFVHIN